MGDPVAPVTDDGADMAPQPTPLRAALDAARAAGGPSADPARWQRIEALARRAEAHHGAMRQLLDARLQALLAGAKPPVDAGGEAAVNAALPASPVQTLRALRAHLEPVRPDAAEASAAPRDLKVVQTHRAAWTQLRAEQRVAQSQTALPDQAGPLNSQLLLHRALTLMRETAPGYLQHFMGQAEALMWLERALAAPPPAAKSAPRGKPVKAPASSARGRPTGKTAGRAARG
ncbi:DUF2894 domain-containing protein [Ottowia flava]|uniref:DUF2894 domain-containing protein n=1 Tax=Ottowia flava TaxID=2675430 RepID=A0ABW4L1Y1_9BURK|nr:DUF2894 domain-containing protein [Ottowia sp. GY511]